MIQVHVLCFVSLIHLNVSKKVEKKIYKLELNNIIVKCIIKFNKIECRLEENTPIIQLQSSLGVRIK